MAKGKKGFMLYADQIDLFDELSDELAGKLIKHIYRYVNDQNPVPPSQLIKIAFSSIKSSLKRDLKKYEKTCTKNKENILKRWNKKDTTVYDRIPNDTKHTDIDTDNDKGIDKGKENINKFITIFNSITDRQFKGDDKTKRQLNARIKDGYTIDEIIKATENCKKDQYHIDNPQYLTPEFITRSDKLQKYLNVQQPKRKLVI